MGIIETLLDCNKIFSHGWVYILLLVHMQSISQGAMLASVTLFSITELQNIGIMLRTKSIFALLVLIAITTISVINLGVKSSSEG